MYLILYPDPLECYIETYGKHFNESLCKFAISLMKGSGKSFLKDYIDSILLKYNIVLNNNELWDYIYVANTAALYMYSSSIKDEEALAKFIKDMVDEYQPYKGSLFCHWVTDMEELGICIDWLKYL